MGRPAGKGICRNLKASYVWRRTGNRFPSGRVAWAAPAPLQRTPPPRPGPQEALQCFIQLLLCELSFWSSTACTWERVCTAHMLLVLERALGECQGVSLSVTGDNSVCLGQGFNMFKYNLSSVPAFVFLYMIMCHVYCGLLVFLCI